MCVGQAWREKTQAKENRGKGSKEGKGKKLNPHYKQSGAKGKNKGKGKGKGKPGKGKGGSLPIPACILQRQREAAAASQESTMVQHMLQKGASCTSLLVESGSLPAADSAPERSSLANRGPAATTHTSLDKWPTTLAITDFSAMAWRTSVGADCLVALSLSFTVSTNQQLTPAYHQTINPC